MESSESMNCVKTRSMKDFGRKIATLQKRQYQHVCKEKKIQLIQTILQQKCKIKKIAHDLNINYATAKTILHCYKKKQFSLESTTNYKVASIGKPSESSKLQVQTKLGDIVTNQYEFFSVLRIQNSQTKPF